MNSTTTQHDTETIGWIEARAVYATDHATGATIEQVFELSAPIGDEDAVKRIIADHTGRVPYSIEEITIIDETEREQISDPGIVYRETELSLGGV